MCIKMKDQFKESRLIANNLSAGDLTVLCLANLIRNALFGQFFFVAPDGGDFWDGINTVRKKFGSVLSLYAKCVTCGEASLLHGGGCQRWETDHITDPIDIWDVRLEMFIDLQEAAFICCQPSGFDIE